MFRIRIMQQRHGIIAERIERGLGAADLDGNAGHGGRGIAFAEESGIGDLQYIFAFFVAFGPGAAGFSGGKRSHDRTVQFFVDSF